MMREPLGRFRFLILLGSFFMLFGCDGPNPHPSSLKARSFSIKEKRQDFDTAVSYFRNYYAPLKYKERILGLTTEVHFAELREQINDNQTDLQFFQTMARLLAYFQDGHVKMSVPFLAQHRLPFIVDNIGGQFIVVHTDKQTLKSMGINIGDRLISIDNKSPEKIIKDLAQYHSFGSDKFDQHILSYYLTRRSFLLPDHFQSEVVFQRNKDSELVPTYLTWDIHNSYPSYRQPLPILRDTEVMMADSSKLSTSESPNLDMAYINYGAKLPFFASPAFTGQFKVIDAVLTPKEWNAIKNNDVTLPISPADVYAVFYRFKGQIILLLRIHTYNVDNPHHYLTTIREILKKYNKVADVLVIDQTHNAGGDVQYMESLFKMLIKKPGPGLAFAPRADRKWINFYADLATKSNEPYLREMYTSIWENIDQAHMNNQFLAPPFSISLSPTLVESNAWDKPILVLINELCASGGDAFPMLLKEHQRATLFGETTAGMAGSVEEMPPLPNSGIEINLTRSLFYVYKNGKTLSDSAIIENKGIAPDIAYPITADDFYDNYLKYTEAFSSAAIELLSNEI